MKIISHRGFWQHRAEMNGKEAFARSAAQGFGIETDVRDLGGKLVLSHDMPTGYEMPFKDFLDLVRDQNVPIAVNIKADGLATELQKVMATVGGLDWFAFDMSLPDTFTYLDHRLPVFIRMSEYERDVSILAFGSGVWLDSFSQNWFDITFVKFLLDAGKRVCVVSPELHGRTYETLWGLLKPVSNHPNLLLCTDHPKVAAAFFGSL